MKKKFLSAITLLTACCSLLSAADIDAIISKARSQLGSESALNGVTTLQYFGTIYNGEGKEIGRMELKFKKPHLQRLDLIEPTRREVTSINEYEGFVQQFGEDDQSLGLVVLNANQIKQMQLNANENLNFFHGPKHQRGGKVELLESKPYEGVNAHMIRFSYGEQFYYDRVFAADSGELLVTVSGSNGFELKEKEKTTVSGIQFPQEVLTYSKTGELLRRVAFDKILVNEPINDEVFEFPKKY